LGNFLIDYSDGAHKLTFVIINLESSQSEDLKERLYSANYKISQDGRPFWTSKGFAFFWG
jgi:hypothetical protein